MKKAYMLLAVCLAFPLSVFAVVITSMDVVIASGVESIALQDPC